MHCDDVSTELSGGQSAFNPVAFFLKMGGYGVYYIVLSQHGTSKNYTSLTH